MKLEMYQVRLILDQLKDYVIAIHRNIDSPDVEDSISESNQREVLEETIQAIFQLEE